jgi:hypothetical protein
MMTETMMTKFFAGVLSVIAMGILLVAYALLNLSASGFDPRANMDPYRPMNASERLTLSQDPYAARWVYDDGSVAAAPSGYAPYAARPAVYPYSMNDARPVRTMALAPAPRRVVATQSVDRRPRRDWKKTALVIGGSTAGAAGLGAVFGGKKGALIGAAIGGGASTIYEATKR